MSVKIYKYPLEVGLNAIKMPPLIKSLSVGAQGDQIMLWIACENTFPTKNYKFTVFATGDTIPDYYYKKFIGTVQLDSGFVGHVFEHHGYDEVSTN